MRFSLDEIIKATGAEVSWNSLPCQREGDREAVEGLYEISTDTRTIKNGDIYLPLKGATFDGEDFCDKALEAGAVGCFYTKESGKWKVENGKLNNFQLSTFNFQLNKIFLKVPDTLTAYLQIANFARKKINPIVIGVTGSSGKTTTKEMIYSVVSEKFKTQKTFSNHNNEIGFCQTVLGMQDDCEVLIVEMGMRGLGEIELITKYAQPDYAVITNAGSAHIGRLGSLDNIAKAKCEITHGLKKALIAHDNERIKKFADFEGEKVFYSLNDVEILEKRKGYSRFLYKGNEYELNIEGDYNIENSLSAIEIGLHLGMIYEEIKSGLAKYKPIEKRWECEKIGGYNIINDSYNANPESMKASVSTFMELYPNSVVVLGNMGELGENEVEFHREVGRYLSGKLKVESGKLDNAILSTFNFPLSTVFITVGNLALYIGEELEKNGFDVKHFEDNIETSRYILDNVNIGTTIFLKASRSMKFEEIIENIKNYSMR
ncbi:UDP-N-acetylmuramoyl-tripeptide--D-alanyl-D-alanine ligase [bacterium]|nr:UDP-N-acetylmuramoyl-tripeptide--D-alanyl-D-alanine ligase [bacterium]